MRNESWLTAGVEALLEGLPPVIYGGEAIYPDEVSAPNGALPLLIDRAMQKADLLGLSGIAFQGFNVVHDDAGMFQSRVVVPECHESRGSGSAALPFYLIFDALKDAEQEGAIVLDVLYAEGVTTNAINETLSARGARPAH